MQLAVPRHHARLPRRQRHGRLRRPASSWDPGVATVFATDSDRYSGPGVVVITPVSKLQDIVKMRGLIPQEAGVDLKMTAADFERRSTIIIPLKRAREILKGMGIRVPIRVSTADLSAELLRLRSSRPSRSSSSSGRRAMDDEPQLQLVEIKELSPTSLRCTVRCVAGTVRRGATVEMRPAAGRPVAEGLTVSAIEYAGGVAMEFVDLGRTALVTVTGPIDEVALRAVAAGDAPEQVVPVDLRLVVR